MIQTQRFLASIPWNNIWILVDGSKIVTSFWWHIQWNAQTKHPHRTLDFLIPINNNYILQSTVVRNECLLIIFIHFMIFPIVTYGKCDDVGYSFSAGLVVTSLDSLSYGIYNLVRFAKSMVTLWRPCPNLHWGDSLDTSTLWLLNGFLQPLDPSLLPCDSLFMQVVLCVNHLYYLSDWDGCWFTFCFSQSIARLL